MSDLLNLAVDAHGGLARWNQIDSITVSASITGAIWRFKGKADALNNVVVTSLTKTERLIMDLPETNRRTVFEPHRISIETAEGGLLQQVDDPETSFAGHQRETPWDDVHVAYFSGEALWTYLTTPFLYTYDGFETQEVDPIAADGEIWRRLAITFPSHIKSHTRQQFSCFGPDGLLRRHDYTVDILGGATGLNFASDYRTVDGIVFPSKRRIFAYEGDYRVVKEPLLVAIDMGVITLS